MIISQQMICLRTDTGRDIGNSGSSERGNSGDDGVLVLPNIRTLFGKENRLVTNCIKLNASDLTKCNFIISDNKIINILKTIADLENLKLAYYTIKSKPGNITPGLDGMTLDGISIEKLEKISSDILRGRFKFKTLKRIEIESPPGKVRRLTVPTPMDKVVHQAIKQRLELIFEPIFEENSFGFRPRMSCQKALNYYKIKFRAAT